MPQHWSNGRGLPPPAIGFAVPPASAPKPNSRRGIWILCAALAVSAWLLFFRLGHYALWDDEAGTALTARSMLRTGGISALVDEHNVFAYRNGFGLEDLKLRYVLPVPAALTAGSFAAFGETSAFAARFPFALLGLATVATILWWVYRAKAPPLMLALISLGLLLNVSLLLHFRQARYFAPVVLLSAWIVYLYLQPRWTVRSLVLAGFLSALLFGSSYLSYVALYGVLFIDYLFWRRKERPLAGRDWVALFLPQLVLCGAIAAIWNPLLWNPLGISAATGSGRNSIGEMITLFGWQWRDLNRCEFLGAIIVVVAAVVGFIHKDRWLVRSLAATVGYIAIVTVLSPQRVADTQVADVRYLAPLIPLGVFLAVRTLLVLTRGRAWLAVPAAAILFGSNLVHGGPLLWSGARSTIKAYVGELLHPPADPYKVASDWVNAHVQPKESVWVLPDYMAYPLMFHAPKAVYAWQLTAPPAAQFRDLPAIHFKGIEPPDYVLVFGPTVQQVVAVLGEWRKVGAHYEHAATLNHYWRDLHRPELFWRVFEPVRNFDPNTEAIYVFQRQTAPRTRRDSG